MEADAGCRKRGDQLNPERGLICGGDCGTVALFPKASVDRFGWIQKVIRTPGAALSKRLSSDVIDN